MARIDEVLRGEKTWGRWWLDQLGHTGLGAAWSVLPIAAVVWFGGGFWLSMAVGQPCAIGGGVIRERWQLEKSGKLHLLDRVLDVAGHLPGPPVAFALVLLVRLAL